MNGGTLTGSYSVHRKAMIAAFQTPWVIIPIRHPVMAQETAPVRKGLSMDKPIAMTSAHDS
jgi:hypothetical protein